MIRNKKEEKTGRKEKAQRQALERQARVERIIEECDWGAHHAYHAGNYQEAFRWAMKGLKVNPSHQRLYHVAWESARNTKEPEMTFNVLRHGWNEGFVTHRQMVFLLGQMAFERKQYALAEEAFEALVEGIGKVSESVSDTHGSQSERDPCTGRKS